jgi:AraC-like DNA-binding protein
LRDGRSADDPAVVRFRDIAAASDLVGEGFKVVAPVRVPDGGGAALSGLYRLDKLHSGLVLHATEATDLHDMTTQVAHRAGLTIGVFLEGGAEISLGRARVELGAACRSEPRARAFAIAYAEQDLFVRHGRSGNRAKKVCIGVPPEWLDGESFGGGDNAIRRFAHSHMANARWLPSARHARLAADILASPARGSLLEGLYLDSRAIDIVAEALARFAEPSHAMRGLNARELARLARVRERLEAESDTTPRLADIARDVGMSVSVLQRHFRVAFGMSVLDFVRRHRLEHARDLLERDLVSVSEAAYGAGYGNPANFATAFKRLFGHPPRAARRR